MARIIGYAGGAAINIDLAAAPEFIGPAIGDFTVTLNVAMLARAFAGRFDAALPLTFVALGVLPTGLSLSAAGVLSGTPTVLGTYPGISIRASDGTDTIDSNTFSITVSLASTGISRSGISANEISNANIGEIL